MKKLILLGLLTPVFLASCSIDWNDAKTERITELEKQVNELRTNMSSGMTVFEKRTRCGALSDDIEKRLGSIQEKYNSLGEFSMGGVFYSPTKDACLWIRLTSTYAPDGSPMERRALYQYGDDFGAAEPIIGCEKILGEKQGVNTCEQWDRELLKLKGEEGGNILNP